VANDNGRLSRYSQEKTNKLLDFYLNYVKELPGISSRLDVTAGYSYQDFQRDEPIYPILTEEGDELPQNVLPIKTQNTLIGFFGRLNYAFRDKYLLTANIRRDGSSRFRPGNKWGTFPSVAVAWKINEEDFLKTSGVFSDLKLRAGYGLTASRTSAAISRTWPGTPTVRPRPSTSSATSSLTCCAPKGTTSTSSGKRRPPGTWAWITASSTAGSPVRWTITSSRPRTCWPSFPPRPVLT
jgi:hypothetical protein